MSLEDLFIAGIILDVFGALVLARGLVARPEVLARRTSTTLGFNAAAAIAGAEGKVDGWLGGALLAVGFAVQAVGYVALVSGAAPGSPGLGTAVSVIPIGAVAVAVALAVLSPRERAIRRQLALMAVSYSEDRLDALWVLAAERQGQILAPRPERMVMKDQVCAYYGTALVRETGVDEPC